METIIFTKEVYKINKLENVFKCKDQSALKNLTNILFQKINKRKGIYIIKQYDKNQRAYIYVDYKCDDNIKYIIRFTGSMAEDFAENYLNN